MARIVVTGGAGFVGSHLCDALIARGDEVVAVDNLSTGRIENVAHLGDHPGFTFVRGRRLRRDPGGGQRRRCVALREPGEPAGVLAIPLESLDVSSIGTRRALDLALANESRFLFASTSEIYGDPHVHPQPESYNGKRRPERAARRSTTRRSDSGRRSPRRTGGSTTSRPRSCGSSTLTDPACAPPTGGWSPTS